ncbi:TetR family transcriptional regulator [Nocardia sp. NPDC051787]|uniref:TetR/AcrR family transcriptional regulator n=1 Tax=Nocardia sp. NPDC051787 TaxID=3155415 RepID=UPI003431F90E
MGRPRQPLLSRERIVSAALAVVDADGLDAVSIRRLAAELGVRGPSLYNHVATKDDLLDAMVDTVVAEVDLSMFTGGPDWRGALEVWARSYRAALARHPRLVPALNQGMGRRPNALRQADAVFGGLVAAGWPRRAATEVGALLRFFVTGSTLGSFAADSPTTRRSTAARIRTWTRRTCWRVGSGRSMTPRSTPGCRRYWTG